VKYVINDQVVLSRAPEGPVVAYLCPFANWVRQQGYTIGSLRERIRTAAGFSCWLGRRAVRPHAIRSRHCAEYLQHRLRQLGRGPRSEHVALSEFLQFLRDREVISAEKEAPRRLTAAELCAQAFGRYLREERALSEASLLNYVPHVRELLDDRFGDGAVKLSRLRAEDIVGFVRRRALSLHRKRAKLLTAGLRSFLRYARLRGEIQTDLAAAVPCVANWSMPSIPRGIAPDQVRQLLSQVDRSTPLGRRDYAILLLLAKLGLRASEVVNLELQDIDCRVAP